jgi:CDP-glucose 4,6-dehydratase
VSSFKWRNRRVLVTGADGFLGSNLVKSLLNKGADVVTFSRSGIGPRSLLTLEGLADHVHAQILGSVEDFERLNTLIQSYKIDTIYHLAALPLVEVGQVNPIPALQINIGGTWNVLEAARLNKVRKIIAVSTVHVYGDNPKLPFKEAYYPQPSRPYETSKACADLIAQSYADTYELGVEIPRFANLYGPGDLNTSRLVPKVIKTILAGDNPHLWDNGAIRDFLYIDDAITALELLAERPAYKAKRNRIYNFGSGRPMEAIDLAKKIVEIANNPKISVVRQAVPEDRTKEIQKQYVSIAKAKKELGWRPTTRTATALRQTLDWYEQYRELL